MTTRFQVLRSSTTGNVPAAGSRQPGELWLNFADFQAGFIDTSKTAQKLVAVRYFQTTANYVVGDFVIQGGALYVANTAVTAGAFSLLQWTKLTTVADLSGLYLPLVGGTLSGPLVLAADPAANLQPATKQYVDAVRVNVKNFGAVGDGVADDTSAIQAAINSLPNDGGIVIFPAGRNYKITSSLNIGNGTASAVSTRRGVILRGDGVPNTPTGVPSFNGYTPATGPKLTWAGGATAIIRVLGPLQGWGVQNLFLDGASIAGSTGVAVLSASFGDCSNLTVQNCAAVGVSSTTYPMGGYSGVGNVDALRNNWTNIFVYVPAVAAAKGILLNGEAGGTSDTDYNVFTNVFIRGAGSTNTFGLYLGVCDANIFNNISISGFAGSGVGMQLDYSSNANFPVGNTFYNYEVGGATPFAVAGTPNAFALTWPNRFYGWLGSNGAPPPSVAGAWTAGEGSTVNVLGTASVSRQIIGCTGTQANPRVALVIGTNVAESGSNAGSNFAINTYTDAGAYLNTPMSISRSTNVASFAAAIVNGPSDRTLKENIAPLDNALGKVNALQGVSFNMIGATKREIGLIAQDVEPVVPEIIQAYESIDSDGKAADPKLALDYPKLTALLIEAVKELSAKVMLAPTKTG